MASKSKKSPKVAKKAGSRQVSGQPALLSGGNPQIAKAEGDAPVQAYTAAMPGWKQDVGLRLDALIVRTVPGMRKAVKTRRFTGSRAGAGSSACIVSPTTSKWPSSAAHRCDRCRPVPARARTRATSTSARRASSMNRCLPHG